jgi:oligoendopeptidase F
MKPASLRHLLGATLIAAQLALAGGALAQASTSSPAVRWNLADLYATPEAWDSAYKKLREQADTLPALQNSFGASAESLRQALLTISDAQRELWRLFSYARLKGDEDLRFAPAQERVQQAQALAGVFDEKTAWVAPAVIALGAERINAFLAADTTLRSRFDFYLQDTLRGAPHTLAPEAESVLAASSVVLAQPHAVFQQLGEAELPRGSVKLSNGKTVKLSTDAYEVHRSSPVRADRKKVFDTFFGDMKRFEGSLGASLAAQVQGNIFHAKSRKHASTLPAALFGDNMPSAVYETLVAEANKGLPTLHRYLALRKKLLGITGPLAYYDNYPPLVPRPKSQRFDVETSKTITLAALAPMGDEYLGHLKRGFAAKWTDSHPRPGKASGAYVMGSAYDVHPYVLLNHSDDFESLSTFAHEWGHAVHTLLANAAQPFGKAGYSTFIAESASIANEMLLSDYMVARAKTAQEKRYYLAQALESIRTTFFRQVMFAEFQLAMHKEVEAGKPLSGRRLSELYCDIAKRYYGQAQGVMNIDPAYCIEWAYISHFYYGYYVWQYATSMVGAALFTDAIQKEGAPARDRFMTMLKAGGSDFPYPMYVKAGVDLAQAAPYRALMARMNRLMDEFEQLGRP